MLYTPMTKKAMKLCYQLHRGQTDKSGIPYVFHPVHLAEQMKTEITVTVALLHDTVEDTDMTLERLYEMGFPMRVISALRRLSRNKGEDYFAYIRRARLGPDSLPVKREDLRHNSNLTRLDEIQPSDEKRREKYRRALGMLKRVQRALPEADGYYYSPDGILYRITGNGAEFLDDEGTWLPSPPPKMQKCLVLSPEEAEDERLFRLSFKNLRKNPQQ